MSKERTNKGFTLIELLVVISIIAFLSSIILVVINSKIRPKARNAYAQVETHEYVNALELYYDTNGFYPFGTASLGGNTCLGHGPCGYAETSSLITALDPYVKGTPSAQPYPVTLFGSPNPGAIYNCNNYDVTNTKCLGVTISWMEEGRYYNDNTICQGYGFVVFDSLEPNTQCLINLPM